MNGEKLWSPALGLSQGQEDLGVRLGGQDGCVILPGRRHLESLLGVVWLCSLPHLMEPYFIIPSSILKRSDRLHQSEILWTREPDLGKEIRLPREGEWDPAALPLGCLC